MLELPVLLPVRQRLRRSVIGRQFTGSTRNRAAALMRDMPGTRGFRRLIGFQEILDTLASSNEGHPIASPGFAAELNPFDQDRMNRVFQFIEERLDQTIRLTDAARRVHLSDGAFSRFFHQHTGRTFPAFVNQLRIGRACRLLADSELNITEIAMACGFTNLSNFNRQFLRLQRTSPRDYRKLLAGPKHASGAGMSPGRGRA